MVKKIRQKESEKTESELVLKNLELELNWSWKIWGGIGVGIDQMELTPCLAEVQDSEIMINYHTSCY
jgi:hypothetical protein